MSDWHDRAGALVADLVAAGELVDPAWRTAMLTVPRHVFLSGHSLEEAYADDAVVTQRRAARDPSGGAIELPSSSASAPSVVAAMLERLQVRDGMRVLEIGTGTGYSAALLSQRLGDHSVFSIDIDAQLVANARRDLATAGYRPSLRAGDGRDGWPDSEPFDRIVATCAVNHIPPAWIAQLSAGGRIVAPLDGPGNALMVLEKTAPDEVVGGFDPRARVAFMPLRQQVDSPLALGRTLGYTGHGMAQYDTTDTDPAPLSPEMADDELLLFVHLYLPGLAIGSGVTESGEQLSLGTRHGLAQVAFSPVESGRWTTEQRGHRLWDTAEHALRQWTLLGKPDRSRYGIAALDRTDRQYIFLDDPESPVSWAFPL